MFFRVCRYVQIVFIHSCGMDAEHLKNLEMHYQKEKRKHIQIIITIHG